VVEKNEASLKFDELTWQGVIFFVNNVGSGKAINPFFHYLQTVPDVTRPYVGKASTVQYSTEYCMILHAVVERSFLLFSSSLFGAAKAAVNASSCNALHANPKKKKRLQPNQCTLHSSLLVPAQHRITQG
jgi:hypothetical protein